MTTSCLAPRWRRILYRIAPFLFKKCPGGNKHWRWDQICYCRSGEHCGNEWHGGILDMRTGTELVRWSEDIRYRPPWEKLGRLI